MVLSITLNPSVDLALFVEHLKLGDTNRVIHTERDAGGKGVNLSRVVVELGGHSVATGFLGGGAGAYVRRVLDLQGVEHDFVEVHGETRTNFSVEDSSESPPTTFNQRGPEISSQNLEELFLKCRSRGQEANWAALGGSLPPGVPTDVFFHLGELVKEHGCRFVLDADGEPMRMGLAAKPHFIKPNAKEAARLLGRALVTKDDFISAARELVESLDPAQDSLAVISLGAEGAVLATRGRVLVGQSPEVEAKSTIGSGDSLIGGMLWALEAGLNLDDAFQHGLAAGAATATTSGSEICRRRTVKELLPQATVSGAP